MPGQTAEDAGLTSAAGLVIQLCPADIGAVLSPPVVVGFVGVPKGLTLQDLVSIGIHKLTLHVDIIPACEAIALREPVKIEKKCVEFSIQISLYLWTN